MHKNNCRRLSQYLATLLLLISTCTVSLAADLLVVTDYKFAQLQNLVADWEKISGHRAYLVSAQQAQIAEHADVHLTSYNRLQELTDNEKILVFENANSEHNINSLLTSNLLVIEQDTQENQGWIAAPLPAKIPVLVVLAKQANEKAITIPTNPDWDAIINMASQLTDPLGNIYGICINPSIQHASVLRSMLVAENDYELKQEDVFQDDYWKNAGQTYARLLAANGPPNAANLTKAEYEDLISNDKCGMWLTFLETSLVTNEGVHLLAIPSSEVFLRQDRPVVVIRHNTTNPLLASQFAWWLVTNSSKIFPEGISADANALSEYPAQTETLLLQAVTQQPKVLAENFNSWYQIDVNSQDALAQLIDGLISVEQAYKLALTKVNTNQTKE